MTDGDEAILSRITVSLTRDPPQFGRHDLLHLMKMAGLDDTRPFLRVALGREDTVSMDATVVRAMMRRARDRDQSDRKA